MKFWIKRYKETGDVEEIPKENHCNRRWDNFSLARGGWKYNYKRNSIKSKQKEDRSEFQHCKKGLIEKGIQYGSVLVKSLLNRQAYGA